jgi:DNA mismatch repair protein MutS
MSEEIKVSDLIEKSQSALTHSELEQITQEIIINSKWDNNISFSPSELHKNTIKINQNVYMDLEMFSSYTQKPEDTIYDQINNTYTSIGNVYLRELLLNPTRNQHILQKRQQIIQNISKNKEKYEKIHILLNKLKMLEKDGLWVWMGVTNEFKELLGQVCFQNKYLSNLNQSETVLKLYNFFQIIFVPLYGLLSPIIFFAVPYLIVRFFYGIDVPFWFYYGIFKSLLFGGTGIGNIFGNNAPTFIIWGQYLVKIMSIAFYVYGIYNSFYAAYTLNKITNLVHNKVNHLSRFIRTSYQLNLEVQDIFGLDLIEIPIKELCDSLFDMEPYLMSNKGKILSTFNIIQQHKDKLESLIQSVSIIDAHYSITKLYLEKDYSFSEYIIENNDDKNPYVMATELWNPFFDSKKAIKNSIQMGGNKPHNIVITGPNASGKSTFIKSLMLNVLLAQTITISSANGLKITPFQFINTYLNIPDVKGRESLFEAEMNRSKQHIDDVNKLPKDQYSLVVMDEIFNSTNYEEGVAGAYIVAKELGKIQNSLSIITTHFPYLTKLSKTGNFLNYKFEVSKVGSVLKPTYRIKEGSSKQHLALDMLEQKGYNKDVINEARQIFKELVEMTHKHDTEVKKIDKSTISNKNKNNNNNNTDNINIINEIDNKTKEIDLVCVIDNENSKEKILEKIQKAVEEKVSKDLSSN